MMEGSCRSLLIVVLADTGGFTLSLMRSRLGFGPSHVEKNKTKVTCEILSALTKLSAWSPAGSCV